MLEATLYHEGTDLTTLDARMKEAIAAKLTELTHLMYGKVVENLSGKILQKRTGQLLGSVREDVSVGEYTMIGSVYIDPTTPKAVALEKGGDRIYPIVPTKALMLKFFWEKMGRVVYLPGVDHPPSREFAYLQIALEEMAEQVPEGFRDAIQALWI